MRVGFVGLGTMGGPMAANAARKGFEVSAWNRTPGRAQDLEELGVRLAATPAPSGLMLVGTGPLGVLGVGWRRGWAAAWRS